MALKHQLLSVKNRIMESLFSNKARLFSLKWIFNCSSEAFSEVTIIILVTLTLKKVVTGHQLSKDVFYSGTRRELTKPYDVLSVKILKNDDRSTKEIAGNYFILKKIVDLTIF